MSGTRSSSSYSSSSSAARGDDDGRSSGNGNSSSSSNNDDEVAEDFVDVKGYYTCLELKRMDASLDEIKKSYRRLLLQFHPDKNPDQAAAQQV